MIALRSTYSLACALLLLCCVSTVGCTSLPSTHAGDAGDPESGGIGGMSGGASGASGTSGTTGMSGMSGGASGTSGVGGMSGGVGGMSGGSSGTTGGTNMPDPCDEMECGDEATCEDGECVPIQHCASTPCDDGKACVDDLCVPECTVDDSCELGESCIDEADCDTSDCESGKCHPVCRDQCDLGDECVNDGDCASGNCDRASDALTGVCRPACAVGGCDTAEACTRNLDCSDGVCSDHLCQPTCGSSCAPGDACASSTNCAGDDICDEIAHVCLTSCTDGDSDYVLTTSADFTNARFCWEIDDNLTITANYEIVTADDLPYLREVTGTLWLQGFDMHEVTLPRLDHVDGAFGTGNSNVERIYFPSLLQIGTSLAHGDLTLGLAVVTEVEMPALTTLYGSLTISGAPYLQTLRLGALERVSGSVTISSASALTTVELGSLDERNDVSSEITIQGLQDIPWTTFESFVLPARGNEDISDVGCNTASPCNCGNTSCVPAPTP